MHYCFENRVFCIKVIYLRFKVSFAKHKQLCNDKKLFHFLKKLKKKDVASSRKMSNPLECFTCLIHLSNYLSILLVTLVSLIQISTVVDKELLLDLLVF